MMRCGKGDASGRRKMKRGLDGCAEDAMENVKKRNY